MSKHDLLSRSLVDAAMELHCRRLWKAVPVHAPFLLRVPNEEYPIVATITGHDGTEYGLSLVRGRDALAQVVAVSLAQDANGALDERMSVLCVEIDSVADMKEDERRLTEDAGFQVRYDGLGPLALAKAPFRAVRPANRAELRILRDCARAVLAVHDAGNFEPRALDVRRHRILELVVESGPRGTVSSRWVPWPDERALASIPRITAFDAPAFSPDLPRLDERWLAARILTGALSDEDEDEEGTSADEADESRGVVLLVVEEESGRLVGLKALESGEVDRFAAAFAQLFVGEGEGDGRRPGLPREIEFTSQALQLSLDQALAKIGVETAFIDEHPALTQATDRFAEMIELIALHSLEDRDLFLPLPKTLAEWKEADRQFQERWTHELTHGRKAPHRAIVKYFGSRAIADDVLRECANLEPVTGFIEWQLADDRATKRSSTFLERRKKRKDITEREYALIEARRQATLSIFRVVSTQPGATIDVEDLLTGARSTIHDRALSGCDIEDAILPLRLYRLGEWTRCSIAGPPLSRMTLDYVFQELEARGVELTPDGLRRAAHEVGRLWRRHLDETRTPPNLRLHNTDGDPLELLTATFRVADPGVLLRAIQTRPGVDFDEKSASGVWSRPGGPAAGFGETTILAHLELLGDRLVVGVNSRKRLARVREWIERVSGVEFERFTTQDLEGKDSPLDDRLRSRKAADEPIPPEVSERIEKMHREECMRWLDTPIPILGNLTPRDACRTVAGRRRVAILIRTMPDIAINGGTIPPPKREMFGELGLEGGA